jgi:exodeoxyribonuclease VII small subunit
LTVIQKFSYLEGMQPVADTTSFEVALKELEKIVAELEKGDTPLESQLKSFEKGVALSRECMKRLEDIERRVEILMQNGDGKLSTSPFEFSP